jgi:signal transduction histidine kinase
MTTAVALTPLLIMTYIDFKLNMNMLESEVTTHTEKTVSNTWRTISFFLTMRRESLEFVARDNSYIDLNRVERLETILTHLKAGIGGFEDIGIVGHNGIIQTYVGPYNLLGTNMSNDLCFQTVARKGYYVKDVHDQTEKTSRLVIAIKHPLPEGSFFVLRSSLDIAPLHKMLSQLEIGELDDAFIMNDKGVLQTPSRFHGDIAAKVSLQIPARDVGAKTILGTDQAGQAAFIGYAHIPDTSLILMIIKPRSEMLTLWYKPRMKLIGFLVLNIGLILVAILGTATYLVNRIHRAHRERMKAVHQVELSNKLASLGRLASGVAHEINNPLAIIDQKAGLIKDLLSVQESRSSDEKMLGLIEGVQSSVRRAGSVTKRLLNFARHLEAKIEKFDLAQIIQDLISMLEQEAAFKHVQISLEAPDIGIEIESDQGNLQQIFLNIINNAFAAMPNGGVLNIAIEEPQEGMVFISVTDSGDGIAPEDLKHIFEPFFTTHSSQNSSGLGLSITYGLLQEIGGNIAVESKVGQGTRFIISLPIKIGTKRH